MIGMYFDIVCVDDLVRPSYTKEDLKYCIGRAKINVDEYGNITIEYTPKS